MIILRRVSGGYRVRLRSGVPSVFIGDNALFNRQGVIADRSAVLAFIDRNWWLST